MHLTITNTVSTSFKFSSRGVENFPGVIVVFSSTKTLTPKHSFQLAQAYFNSIEFENTKEKRGSLSKPDQEKSGDEWYRSSGKYKASHCQRKAVIQRWINALFQKVKVLSKHTLTTPSPTALTV